MDGRTDGQTDGVGGGSTAFFIIQSTFLKYAKPAKQIQPLTFKYV